MARRRKQAGADVVVAQGTEAGGHTGEIGMMSLVPQMIARSGCRCSRPAVSRMAARSPPR